MSGQRRKDFFPLPPKSHGLGFGGALHQVRSQFFPPLKCLLAACICHKKIKFGCSSQTAPLRQESDIFLVEQITEPWVLKVKCCRVRSWFLVTSFGPAEARYFSSSGHSYCRCSQSICMFLTRGTSGCKQKKKNHWLPTSENMFHFTSRHLH